MIYVVVISVFVVYGKIGAALVVIAFLMVDKALFLMVIDLITISISVLYLLVDVCVHAVFAFPIMSCFVVRKSMLRGVNYHIALLTNQY